MLLHLLHFNCDGYFIVSATLVLVTDGNKAGRDRVRITRDSPQAQPVPHPSPWESSVCTCI